MKQRSLFTFLLFGLAISAQAHFVFVLPEQGGTKIKVFLSEDLHTTEAVNVEMIAGAKLVARSADGRETPISLVKTGDAYFADIAAAGTQVIHGVVDLGWMQRGKSEPHILLYYPKTIIGDAFAKSTVLKGDTPVEIVPTGKAGALKLAVIARGKPLPASEITVILPDGSQKKLKTDENGETEVLTQTGRYGAWARCWESAPGERDGKKYEQLRHYATLVFDAPAQGITTSAAATATRFATLPEATSSFGAVVSDGWLYVYGGYIAPTHSYSTAAVSGQFHRLKLADGAAWETLPSGPPLQGMNLAAYDGKIYRIGGMVPHNPPGSKADTFSVAECARFDPATKTWEAFPPLPRPRSSHDVVVIGSTLIVVGGWALEGAAGQKWLDTLETLDLSAAKPEWKSAAQPFRRRALIAAAHSGKMYVLGGFNENAEISSEVAVYDPETNSWQKDPEMPGGKPNAFAPAACSHDGGLYVSIADGAIYRLNEATNGWELTGKASPRLAHRMVSWKRTILVIGGALKGNNLDLIERVDIDGTTSTARARN